MILTLFLGALFTYEAQSIRVESTETLESGAYIALFSCANFENLKLKNFFFNETQNKWTPFTRVSLCINQKLFENEAQVKDYEDDLIQIFELCNLAYPKEDIINVVKLNNNVIMKLGCFNSNQETNCKDFTTGSAVVYKCLKDGYESQRKPAEVPFDCERKSLSANKCKKQYEWVNEAKDKCKELKSITMVKPCENLIGYFMGIEAVCCKSTISQSTSDVKSFEDDNIDDDDEYDEDTFREDQIDEKPAENVNEQTKTHSIEEDQEENLINIDGDSKERTRYDDQKNRTLSYFQDKITSLMDKMNEDREKFKNDPSSERVIEADLEKKLNNLNEEKSKTLLRNDLNHDDMVTADINEKKIKAFESFNNLKNLKASDVKILLSSIQKYVTILEVDRLYQTSIYKRLKTYYPDELVVRFESIVNSLRNIDNAIESVQVRLGKDFKDLQNDWMSVLEKTNSKYSKVRKEAARIVAEYESKNEDSTIDKALEPKQKVVSQQVASNLNTNAEEPTTFELDDDDTEDNVDIDDIADDNQDDDSIVDDDDSQEDDGKKEANNSSEEKYEYDDDEDETEKLFFKDSDYEQTKESRLSYKIGLMILAAFISPIIIGSLITRFIKARLLKRGFKKLETNSPEEKHINQMQINGYENPTYKFFEQTIA